MAQATDIEADAADTEWLDEMVKKLKAELEKQLGRVTEAARTKGDAAALAADARTLATLERTLERLAKLEQARALVHETKVKKSHDGARAELQRRLDKLAAAGKPKRAS